MATAAALVVITAALAAATEAAVRRILPLPFAVSSSGIAISVCAYAVATLPAAVLAARATYSSAAARAALAVPVALLAANIAYAVGCGATMVAGVASLLGVVAAAGLRRLNARAALLCALGLLAGLLLTGALPNQQPHSQAKRAPDVLLIVLDTAAASHLSLYGYQRPTTPVLTALARESLVYQRAVSPAPWTLPAHASIFSGRYPSELGFDGGGFRPTTASGSDLADSIAADALDDGRVADAISANPLIPRVARLRAGFDHAWSVRRLRDSVPKAALDRMLHHHNAGMQSHGQEVTTLALDWIDRLAPRDRPWLLFLNYLDPHNPYRPPARYAAKLAPGVDPDSVPDDTEDINAGNVALTRRLRDNITALYDAEIGAMDAALGALLDGLRARGYRRDDLLLIVTADHGEELGAHGFVGHLLGMTDDILHVPLLVAGPAVSPGTYSAPVQTVQLRATIERLANLPSQPGIAPALPPWGSALTLIVSEHAEPRWYLEESLPRRNPSVDVSAWRGGRIAVERDGRKAILDADGKGVLYNLEEDPHEMRPLSISAHDPLVAAYLAWQRRMPSRAQGPLPAKTREALEASGYLD